MQKVKETAEKTDETVGPEKKEDMKSEKNDLKAAENNDPLPSTSSQISVDSDEEYLKNRLYKKSFFYLQLQWCKKQQDFIKLCQDMMETHE